MGTENVNFDNHFAFVPQEGGKSKFHEKNIVYWRGR